MPLTPLEIHNKEFATKMRGYDQDEVNEFLDQVIRDYELVMRQNKELEDELAITNKKLSNFEDMQESLNRSILVAQEAADRLIENTDREVEVIKIEAESYAEKTREEANSYSMNVKKEADEYAETKNKKADDYAEAICAEADKNADELLKEAVDKARQVEEETEALRKQGRVFRQRLQSLVQSHLELLNQEDWHNLLVGDPIEYPTIDTIIEIEKELEEKTEIADETDAELKDNEEHSVDSTEETVAIEEEEHYNDASEESEEYEEGTMPAIELPDSE